MQRSPVLAPAPSQTSFVSLQQEPHVFKTIAATLARHSASSASSAQTSPRAKVSFVTLNFIFIPYSCLDVLNAQHLSPPANAYAAQNLSSTMQPSQQHPPAVSPS